MLSGGLEQTCKPSMVQCFFCGGTTNFKIIANDIDSIHARTSYSDLHIVPRKKVTFLAGFMVLINWEPSQFCDPVNYDVKKFM